VFPASKSHTKDPDDDVTSLNHNAEALFFQAQERGELSPNDKRGHYRLVGAQWMDKPEFFLDEDTLQDDERSPLFSDPDVQAQYGCENFEESLAEEGADSPCSRLAGENRLSSTAMESFTQYPNSFLNCLSCHNTSAISARGIPHDADTSSLLLLEPKFINVSHIFSQFILEEVERESEAPAP
jgi:hypothetical protein